MKPLVTEGAGKEQAAQESLKPLVLYVEDDEENWNVTALRLQERFRMVRAATDIEACGTVRAHGSELHAILMDIELKGSVMGGVELTKAFRHKLQSPAVPSYAQNLPLVTAPIVFVTAYGFRYKTVDLLAMGGNQVLEKPVDFGKLSLALATYKVGGLQSATK